MHFISHGSTTLWWSNHRTFHQSRQYHTMVVKSPCISSVRTVPHYGGQIIVLSSVTAVPPYGGQIVVHFISHGSITLWWSKHRAFHQSGQYRTMVVKSSYISSVKTVPPYGGQIIVHFISQDSTTPWRSNRRAFHQSRQYHTVVVRSEACENVTMGGETQTSAPNAL